MSEADDLRRQLVASRELAEARLQRAIRAERALEDHLRGAPWGPGDETPSNRARNDAAHLELRRSEARFRVMIEKSADGISLSAADGTTLYRSPAFGRILGVSAEELAGLRTLDLALPEDRPRVEAQLRGLAHGGREVSVEFRVRRGDGAVRWLEGSATNLLDDPDVGAIVGSFRDITARKELEEAMRESELRYRHLIEALPEPVLVHVDGKIAYANAASARALGLAGPGDLLGRSITELAGPATRARIQERMQRQVAPGEQLEIAEQSFSRADGDEVHAEVKSIRIVFDGGPAMLSIARDITERVEAQRAVTAALGDRDRLVASLEFERQRLGRLLEKAPAFIAVVRGNAHVFELVNEAGGAMVAGRSVVGRSVAEALPELAGQGLIEVLDAVLATGQPRTLDGVPVMMERQVGAPPEQRFVNVVYQPLIEADGTTSGVFVHGFDVTDATLTQQRVRAQFHGVPVPTYVWQRVARDGELQFVLIDFNQAAITASGGEVTGDLGQLARDRFANAPEVVGDLERCLDQAAVIQRELERSLTLDGEIRRLFVTFAPAPPSLVIAHVEDITERSRLEQQLRQAQKMEAVGRLAGGVAHDFNNLLTVILSYAEMALDGLAPGQPLRDELTEIQTAALRASELTRQLLAFSRQQVLQARVVDLAAIVTSMQSMLSRLLGADVELVLRTPPSTARVFADPGQIEQVVMNLAVNARDAMPEGGRLTLETADVVLDEQELGGHPGATPGDHVVLAVSDTGVGMDAATRARMFDPFFTTKDKGKGTGLGLAMVLGIVEQSGGHILVESEPGRGTSFRIHLPRTERAAETASAARHPPALRGSETILLAEDEDQVRAVTCAILRRHGYQVVEAANGEEALRLAEEITTIDLLLTDVIMPRMGGRKLTERLTPLRPAMRVLFMSGYTDEVIIHHAVLDAGLAFLQKPFTPEGLLRKVREVLDAERTRAADPAS